VSDESVVAPQADEEEIRVLTAILGSFTLQHPN